KRRWPASVMLRARVERASSGVPIEASSCTRRRLTVALGSPSDRPAALSEPFSTIRTNSAIPSRARALGIVPHFGRRRSWRLPTVRNHDARHLVAGQCEPVAVFRRMVSGQEAMGSGDLSDGGRFGWADLAELLPPAT